MCQTSILNIIPILVIVKLPVESLLSFFFFVLVAFEVVSIVFCVCPICAVEGVSVVIRLGVCFIVVRVSDSFVDVDVGLVVKFVQ